MIFEGFVIGTCVLAGTAFLWIVGLWWVLRQGRIQHRESGPLLE